MGAEIGVFRGEFTAHILSIVRPKRLHLVDGWWLLFGEHYPDWGAYTDHGRLKTRAAHAEVERVVRRHGAEETCIVHVGDDVEYLESLAPGTLDWVYLDSSHQYDHTRRELTAILRATKPDGIIAGDDWHDDPAHEHHGVARAVREFCADHGFTLDPRDAFGQWSIRRGAKR